MKGANLHPKDHSIQIFTDASNKGCGAHLKSAIRRRKKDAHKCFRVKAGISGPVKVQGPVSKSSASVGCYGQLNSSSL